MQFLKFSFCVVFCGLLGQLSAIYQGNPASCELPQQGILIPEDRAVSFKLGYQIENVFDRKMELSTPQSGSSIFGTSMSSLSNQGVFTLNIIDRVEAFVTFGTMQLSVKQDRFRELQMKAHSTNHFVWSIGGRALLLFWGNTSLGAEASYLSSHPYLESLSFDQIKQQFGKAPLKYDEWQIQVALSQKVSFFSFYLGGAYSYGQLKINMPWYLIEVIYKNRHKISMALGSSLSAKKGLTVNLEAKFFGETSLGANIDLRF